MTASNVRTEDDTNTVRETAKSVHFSSVIISIVDIRLRAVGFRDLPRDRARGREEDESASVFVSCMTKQRTGQKTRPHNKKNYTHHPFAALCVFVYCSSDKLDAPPLLAAHPALVPT